MIKRSNLLFISCSSMIPRIALISEFDVNIANFLHNGKLILPCNIVHSTKENNRNSTMCSHFKVNCHLKVHYFSICILCGNFASVINDITIFIYK